MTDEQIIRILTERKKAEMKGIEKGTTTTLMMVAPMMLMALGVVIGVYVGV